MTKSKKNQFLFMYPIKDYFDVELEKDAYFYFASRDMLLETPFEMIERFNNAKTQEEKLKIQKEELKFRAQRFKPIYTEALNRAIKERYRKNNFGINYAVFNNAEVDSVMKVLKGDRIIKVGVTKEQHFSEKKYPSQDHILEKLPKNIEHLRVAGFHAWDCVERIAKRAYERGINVLVDEDLTQFFVSRFITDDFKFNEYPGYNVRKHFTGSGGYDAFMTPRKGSPWLLQDYPK